MKETPILFSTPMVQAILNGTKTQTRRVVKDKYLPGGEPLFSVRYANITGNTPYQVGNLLWVRETWCYVLREHAPELLEGRKENDQYVRPTQVHSDWMVYAKEKYGYKWKPSIHMPKAAARLWLQITGIRVERLQTITEADAKEEGVEWSARQGYRNYLDDRMVETFKYAATSFATLWYKINGPESWAANPYVWVIEFKVISKTGKP